MAIDNPVFKQLSEAIAPIVSIGVGSAICTVCTKKGLSPEKLEKKDIPVLKAALIEHYQQFWANKIDDIKNNLGKVY